jgi:pyruvate-formate lyase
MVETLKIDELTYQQRLDALRTMKLQHTREKQQIIGVMNYDDWAQILPPPELRKVVHKTSESGTTTDVLLANYEAEPNHPSGSFFGPKACGENFRALLETHPVYIDPMSALAGAYMVNFTSYRPVNWNPDFDFSALQADYTKYNSGPAIGGTQHFCQDLQIGLDLGWGGLLRKIRHYSWRNQPNGATFYEGLENVVLGAQNWVHRHAVAAREMAARETNPQLRQNLEDIADINDRLVTDRPRSFREACQWIAWFQVIACMYNNSSSLGRLDVLLQPYYERDVALGILDDEEAIFDIACIYIAETGYTQIGGPDANGNDVTNHLSYLILEAAHRLCIPVNLCVCVGKDTAEALLRRSVEILVEDKASVPNFLGIDNTVRGFARNGYSLELSRQRAHGGCQWSTIPGREYTLNDLAKINFARVFELAFQDMMAEATANDLTPGMDALWQHFSNHLRHIVRKTAEGFDFHLEHMHRVFPELVLDLCCYGPIENGLDATHGGVEYYNMCVDGAALATVADSFAALEQRIEKEKRLSWQKLAQFIDTDWAGADGEKARRMMENVPHYGSGESPADKWAVRISELFAHLVKESPTPKGVNMIPGLFSWVAQFSMGQNVGATPNGRHAQAPVSHGCNPDPGFRKDGAPTAMAIATARVQTGWGNTCPLQLDIDPFVSQDEGCTEKIMSLIKSHFELGGTQINMNVIDKQKILEANKDPSKYPDLIVRVTGFSAYFASLSPEFRQMVIDRIVAEG